MQQALLSWHQDPQSPILTFRLFFILQKRHPQWCHNTSGISWEARWKVPSFQCNCLFFNLVIHMTPLLPYLLPIIEKKQLKNALVLHVAFCYMWISMDTAHYDNRSVGCTSGKFSIRVLRFWSRLYYEQMPKKWTHFNFNPSQCKHYTANSCFMSSDKCSKVLLLQMKLQVQDLSARRNWSQIMVYL